jgi:hypothetical protein
MAEHDIEIVIGAERVAPGKPVENDGWALL